MFPKRRDEYMFPKGKDKHLDVIDCMLPWKRIICVENNKYEMFFRFIKDETVGWFDFSFKLRDSTLKHRWIKKVSKYDLKMLTSQEIQKQFSM